MDFERIGRARLMVRLPHHRKKLAERDFLALTSLIESYGVAVVDKQERDCQAIEVKVDRLLSPLRPSD
ncbi:hypothetical protein ACU4I5_10820 [Ensifer adhaerens]